MDAQSPRVLARLSDASRAILLLGMVLYLFGFLAIASYLARFGIASFDIINARFISAGLVTIVPVTFVSWVAWRFAKVFPANSWFRSNNRSHRLWFVFLLPSIADYAGTVFANLFKLGTYAAHLPLAAATFRPLGSWDLLGTWLAASATLPADFVTGYLLLAIAYLVLPTALIYATVVGVRYVIRIRRRQPSRAIPDTDTSPGQEQAQEARVPEPAAPATQKVPVKGLRLRLAWGLELALILRVVIHLFFSYKSLGTTVVDFDTIVNTTLDQHIMGHWLLLSLCGCYFTLSIYEVPAKGLARAFWESFAAPNTTVHLLSVVLVPTVAAIVLFGAAIFPRISYTIGGGQPRLITLPEGNALHISHEDRIFLLGESSQHYFLVVLRDSLGSAVQVSKANLPIVFTRRASSALIKMSVSSIDGVASSDVRKRDTVGTRLGQRGDRK